MPKELLACIKNENIKYLHSGQIAKFIFPMEREEAHKKKISHLVIRLFVMARNPDNQIVYLVQKRGERKSSFPNYYTDSASGHVVYKKDLNLKDIEHEAKRELEEEFGVPPSSILKMRFYDLLTEENQYTTEISYVFLAMIPFDIILNPNPHEVDPEGSKFYTRSELIEILNHEQLIDYSKKIWEKLVTNNLNEIFNTNQQQNILGEHKNQIALLIGRFQPLHHGHIYVFKRILKDYNFLKIGIGSAQLSHTKTNPFTSKERIEFIKSALNERNISSERYQIFEIPDIFDANRWVAHVKSIVGNFNIVFSNSEWVRELFVKEGYYVAKKLEIFKKKYNGSLVRKLMLKNDPNWKSLVPKEVVTLIDNFNGIDRLKKLNKT
ncbi:MAG: nicotinamide-nucleotide adenylyltransferase [Candidatus Hermodarchaeota archaeon]